MKRATRAILIFSAATVMVIAVLSVLAINKINYSSDNYFPEGEKITYFYTETCPYCRIVEDYMQENSIYSKHNIEKKDVSSSQNNVNELIAAAVSCGYDIGSIGVPFLYAEGECYVGPYNIMNYFES